MQPDGVGAIHAPARSGIDARCINTLRLLAIDAVLGASSGHLGLPLGAAPVAYVLWTRFLRHNPRNPRWPDRDRFALSAGHGSMLLYGLLHLTGYDLSLEELRSFRQWGSRTPGHPEFGVTPGVELTTGPLGQGFANAVGLAMAEAHLAAVYNRPGHEVVDHYTYVLASDGDLMEGVAQEAAGLAGHLRLGKLICLYDANRTTLASSLSVVSSEDVGARFRACGWDVLTVADAHDLDALQSAIRQAQLERVRPSLVIVQSTIGYGSPAAGTFAAHSIALSADERQQTLGALGWPDAQPFTVPPDVAAHFREASERGQAAEAAWRARFERYRCAHPDLAAQFERVMAGELPQGWADELPTFDPSSGEVATRVASSKVLSALAARLPELIGGSADLDVPTGAVVPAAGDFQHPDHLPADRQGAAGGVWSYAGRNIHFGVREHAMAAIANGLAYHGGCRPFCATFLAFSDYMKPAVRLAALSELPVVFIFSHDSVGLGEDGPTHQPVEQLVGLRATPGLVVLRPADANETAAAWRIAVERRDGPTVLALTRQPVPVLGGVDPGGVARGAYVMADAEGGAPAVILLATGSEVAIALQARRLLAERGIAARVVSMPSWELFRRQPRRYRDSVLPPSVRPRVSVEAGSTIGWERWVGEDGFSLGVDRFGASAPCARIYTELGLTPEAVAARAAELVQGTPARDGRDVAERA